MYSAISVRILPVLIAIPFILIPLNKSRRHKSFNSLFKNHNSCKTKIQNSEQLVTSRCAQRALQWCVKTFEMAQEVVGRSESLAAQIACEWPLPDVGTVMLQKVAFVRKRFIASEARERL